jgi:hypothetical protein
MIIALVKSPVRPAEPEYDHFLERLNALPGKKTLRLISAMRRGLGTVMDGPAARIYDIYVVLDIAVATANTYPPIERFLKELGVPAYELIYLSGSYET